MSTRHRWADVITAWAEGEAIQCQRKAADHVPGWEDKWSDNYPSDSHGTPLWNNPNFRWRIMPRMCSLNGYEFPSAETQAPKNGATYWTPNHAPGRVDSRWTWESMGFDYECLRHGRVHLSKDAAIAHARAEILAVGGTVEDES